MSRGAVAPVRHIRLVHPRTQPGPKREPARRPEPSQAASDRWNAVCLGARP
jgi:hypothetical protein